MPQSKQRAEKKRVHYARALREKLINGQDLKAVAESGFLDNSAINLLMRIKNAKPDSYTNDSTYIQVVENQTSKAISTALRDGNLDRMAHGVGFSSNQSNSSYRKIQRLKSYIDTEGKVYYIDGEPNSGKTNLALLIAEFWREATGGDVASNMTSCKGLSDVVQEYNALEDFFDRDGPSLFIFDDASNHASGYSGDRDAMEDKMRKLTNFIAKKQGVIIFIGHTGKDVHPDIRRKARKLSKNSMKHVDVFDYIDKSGEGADKVMTINDVPEARMDYDPYEETEWSWNIDEDAEDTKSDEELILERIKTLASKGRTKIRTTDVKQSNTKVAEVFRGIERNEYDMEGLEAYKFFEDETPKQLKKQLI